MPKSSSVNILNYFYTTKGFIPTGYTVHNTTNNSKLLLHKTINNSRLFNRTSMHYCVLAYWKWPLKGGVSGQCVCFSVTYIREALLQLWRGLAGTCCSMLLRVSHLLAHHIPVVCLQPWWVRVTCTICLAITLGFLSLLIFCVTGNSLSAAADNVNARHQLPEVKVKINPKRKH